MEVLTQNRLTRNAYRILGLGGDASQEAIDQAARKMRLWASAQRVPPSSWDLPWLGEVQRSKSDIEQAVAALADPPSRLKERQMWFCGAVEEVAAGDLHSIREKLQQVNGDGGGKAQLEHNAAVAELAAAMFQPQPIHPGSWESVLHNFQRLANSQEQLRWQMDLESAGGFEKRASEEEIADSQRAMPREIASSLGRHIESALEDDNVEEASAFLAILRNIGSRTDQRVLDRLEGVLERRCCNVEDDLRRIARREQMPEQNQAAARSAQDAYENSIAPLRRDFEKLADDQPERVKRGRWHCARILGMIGTTWAWAFEFGKAQQVLNSAQELAQGAVQEQDIRSLLDQIRHRVEEQQRYQTQSGAMHVGSRGGRIYKPATPAAARATPQVHSPPQKKGAGGKWAVVLGLILLMRVLSVMVGSDSHKSDPPTYNLDPPRSYYRPPEQPSLFPTPQAQPQSQSDHETAEQIRNRLFGTRNVRTPGNQQSPAPTPQRPGLSSLYDGAPTKPQADPVPSSFSFNTAPPPAYQPPQNVAKPTKSFPEPPSRPWSPWITTENAGLTNDAPPKTGQVPLGIE